MSFSLYRTLPACFLLAAAALAAPAAQAQTPTNAFELNGSTANATGGAGTISLPNPAGLAATGYNFNIDEGPGVSNALASGSVYSLETYFRIDATNGYRKLIDFKNFGTDNGLYNLNGNLVVYQGGANTLLVGAFTPNTLAHLVVTRDGADQFTAYVDSVAGTVFNDTLSTTTFTGLGNVIQVLNDENSEEPSGFLDYFRTYDTVLTQAQVTTLYNNRNTPLVVAATGAPEPSALALLAPALPLAGLVLRRGKPRV